VSADPPPSPALDELVSPEERRHLRLQMVCGHLALGAVWTASVATMRLGRNNRVHGVREARRLYRRALAAGRPTLICANHLTMVDSAFLHWALASPVDYALHYRRFSWNVAAAENFAKNAALRALTFLSKTLAIERQGDDAHRKAVLNRLRWLFAHGEVITIFPEGTRSRTGRVDPSAVTYGIGQLLQDHPDPQVLCCYLRGRRQRGATTVPAWGDTLDLKVELLEPKTDQTAMRGARDLSRQVINALAGLEAAWLAERGADAPAAVVAS
jgi:1-acyl-sn-glycerol-3-phosphate acyltransferase